MTFRPAAVLIYFLASCAAFGDVLPSKTLTDSKAAFTPNQAVHQKSAGLSGDVQLGALP